MVSKVLIADDEQSIASSIAYALKREGFEVELASNGEEALQKVETFQPTILILDVMMPIMNGYDVCRALQHKQNLGILLLTVKNDIIDKVVGLELGADDYMTKPFDIREVIARIKAIERRMKAQVQPQSEVQSIQIGELEVNLTNRSVLLEQQSLELTPKEFDLLALMLGHIERAYSREELLDLVWGMEYIGGTRTVDIHIQRIRKKLGPTYQNILQTVYGIGYKAVKVVR